MAIRIRSRVVVVAFVLSVLMTMIVAGAAGAAGTLHQVAGRGSFTNTFGTTVLTQELTVAASDPTPGVGVDARGSVQLTTVANGEVVSSYRADALCLVVRPEQTYDVGVSYDDAQLIVRVTEVATGATQVGSYAEVRVADFGPRGTVSDAFGSIGYGGVPSDEEAFVEAVCQDAGGTGFTAWELTRGGFVVRDSG